MTEDKLTIELAPFTLADGVDRETLIAASERLETEVLSAVDGYLGRLLLQKDERQWTDLVFWRSKADAEKALVTLAESRICREYFACMAGGEQIDTGTAVTHFAALRSYGIAGGIAAAASAF